MVDLPASWLGQLIDAFCGLWRDGWIFADDAIVRGLLATLLVCFVCGAMGSLVVGNRMAFFSDALAHCAFAGVGFGLLLTIMMGTADYDTVRQQVTLVMVLFGVTIGLLIAFVREQTGLASDTVIGVFYAGSIGIGAVVMKLGDRRFITIEDFIFGNPTTVREHEVIWLIILALLAVVFLAFMYNWLVLASASPSLALSRQVPVRWCRYLFVVLLALMVNLSQQITGTLLINGLLIVPAATAANVAGNLRQMFWLSIGFALLAGGAGFLLSWDISNRFYPHASIGVSGTIIVLSVFLFVLSIVVGRTFRRTV